MGNLGLLIFSLSNELTRDITCTLENYGCFINCSSKLAYLRSLCPWTVNSSFLCVTVTLYSHRYCSTEHSLIITYLKDFSFPLDLEPVWSRDLASFIVNRLTSNLVKIQTRLGIW